MKDDSRINIAASSSHDKTFERGQAHGSIVRTTVLYGVDRCPIANMSYYKICLEWVFAKQHGCALSVVEKARSMESIAANHVFLVPFARESIHIARGWHGLVPGGIHNCTLRHIGEYCCGRFYTHEVCWIMKRREFVERLEGFQEFSIYY